MQKPLSYDKSELGSISRFQRTKPLEISTRLARLCQILIRENAVILQYIQILACRISRRTDDTDCCRIELNASINPRTGRQNPLASDLTPEFSEFFSQHSRLLCL